MAPKSLFSKRNFTFIYADHVADMGRGGIITEETILSVDDKVRILPS